MQETGWNNLYVYANGEKSLMEQHRGAGFLEGYATFKEIYSAYNNLAKSIIKAETLGSKVQSFIDEQQEYLEHMVAAFPLDLYWQHAGAYLDQVKFMYRGYIERIHRESRLDMYIGWTQFYYLTNVGDLEDLIPAFTENYVGIHEQAEGQKLGNCNGYVKLKDDQLLIGHSTHNIYAFLLRIFKSYHFPTRNPRVGTERITFSSRPGDIISKDDFYVLSSGLKVLETSFANYNKDNYLELKPRTVPSWLRANIANNLARNAEEWVEYFSKEQSGTHNNQWMIIDSRNLPLKKGVVVFYEDAFSIFEVTDMTPLLLKQGWVGSYNIPYS